MMMIKTYLARSPIHGIGVFAAEPVPEGTVLWQIDLSVDKEFSRLEFESLPGGVREWIAPYVFVTEHNSLFFCGDHARFMNHSNDANVIDVNDKSVAARRISVGEELTFDYGTTTAKGLGISDSFLRRT